MLGIEFTIIYFISLPSRRDGSGNQDAYFGLAQVQITGTVEWNVLCN